MCRYADRIAYLTHDVEDAVRAGIIGYEDLPAGAGAVFGEPGREWIGSMIQAVVDHALATGEVAMGPREHEAMHDLREFMFARVYLRPEVDQQARYASALIHALVDHFVASPAEVPATYRAWEETDPLTQAIDYVAGMTDRYAIRLHDELFG